MSELSIQLKWQLGEGELVQGKYSNSHEITYNDQFKLTADAAPDWGGDIANTNPEQALAASISSCHMMTFLALASKAKWQVSCLLMKIKLRLSLEKIPKAKWP